MKEFFKGKKILITGNTGFKGSWLSQILLEFGAEVIGVSLLPNTNPSLFNALGLDKKMKTYYCDVRNFDALQEIVKGEQPEAVFHLAAQAIVRDSYDDPLKTFSVNTLGTANVLQAVRDVGCVKSAVIITTDKVYKNNEWIYPYRETDALGGYDPYSASKAAADIIANSYIQSFFNVNDFGQKHNTLVAIARAGNVIGGGDWSRYRLVPDIIRAIYDKKEDVVLRNPQSIRPWQHVFEPLSGYLKLAQRLYERNVTLVGAWNFGPHQESFVSVEELVKNAVDILGCGNYRIEADTTKHEDNFLTLDVSKADLLLKWRPKINFNQSIKMTFDWYKSYYENSGGITDFTNKQIELYFEN
ncbi:MAG: CDP-glucose 4,6-dehydratase [Patescibacteria group bacterium]|jgi:CDP-glucose 4,6-dehydratase